MSTTILHGENQKESREALREIIQEQKQKDVTQTYLNGEKVDKKDLETKLLTNNLFSKDAIIIENLLSARKSNNKEGSIETLSNYKGEKTLLSGSVKK